MCVNVEKLGRFLPEKRYVTKLFLYAQHNSPLIFLLENKSGMTWFCPTN